LSWKILNLPLSPRSTPASSAISPGPGLNQNLISEQLAACLILFISVDFRSGMDLVLQTWDRQPVTTMLQIMDVRAVGCRNHNLEVGRIVADRQADL
jgi:hypothetical protein